MKISSRFTVAVHILALLKIEKEYTLTSSQIAESVNTNPVVIRRLMGKLKDAGFIEVSRGNSGVRLLKSLDEITLFDVYKAVEVVEQGHLFQIHEDTNINCTVGANIQIVLEVILENAQDAMEAVLKSVTLDNIVNKILVNNG
ncbi:Rrf2 family transcriptional regulator [Staphylococcus arlettae]|uniref:Transcriptional regulator n=1 Tax=Staphylococcus arlettae TaxID=29378 RepID=A0A380BV01_9STAP|nr:MULTISPECIES: Rrf2 family transcriptional regulator [Staphylococcus]MCD8835023.1 Rrf2 family transcriptional regulator [Staphylococcus arlettae]MEB5899578.1 Rrf2 family transcriptional regulator [Staphylococcus arlettae]PNZ54596.1 transcriptional regulator [Staphylococcus arlettae]PTH24155.1 Rrf2 family transcriptional regulator [Staphylococcus arlettae]PTH34734.1 Rrf2 family transcriptional regulator [Staphylococcus arlettae]